MPAHDPTKTPSDAKIVQAFNQFEEAFNIIDAALRHKPELIFPDAMPTAIPTNIAYTKDALIAAHRIFHEAAGQADLRLDLKRLDKALKAEKKERDEHRKLIDAQVASEKAANDWIESVI